MLGKNRNIIKNNKIVFKIYEFPHISETFIVAQIITAIQLGYEIRILVGKLLSIDNSSNPTLIKEYNLFNKTIIEDYKIPKNRMIRLLKWIVILTINFKRVKQIFHYYKEHSKFSLTWLYQWDFYNQFNDADIFHAQYGTNSSTLSLLKKVGFKPSLIVSFHGHDAFFPIYGFIPNNGYYNNLFKYGDLVVANTPYLADKIIDLGCPIEKLKIIPVAVDTDFFYHKQKSNSGNIVMKLITVGRLDPVKGHIYCVEAVKKLIEKGNNVTLTIVGEGAEKSNLEALIQKYNLQNYVFMEGRKSQLEIRQLLWEHNLYLLAAVALPDGRRETQGLATLEAQACSLPAVVFDSGGVKYTIDNGKTGFVCKEYDTTDLVSKIEMLYNDMELLKNMSKNAVDFIEQNYSQKVIDHKWEIVYSDLK